MSICDKEKYDISIIVYLLVIVFGTGSWVAVNGLWVELPLLVPTLPEKWALPSYLVVVIQLANIGPLLFFIGNSLKPKRIREVPVVYVLVTLGAGACFLLAFFWDKTTYVAGSLHSTALLVLTFCLALVDCTSSIVFLPFMARLKPQYMTAYYIGEGFSGLVPSLVALGQGAGEYTCVNTSSVNKTTNETTWAVIPVYQTASFPPGHFYFFTFAMMVLCGVAFFVLNIAPVCKKELVEYSTTGISSYTFDESQESTGNSKLIYGSIVENEVTDVSYQSNEVLTQKHVVKDNGSQQQSTIATSIEAAMTLPQNVYLLSIIFGVNALTNGVLTSAQTYSTLPYGPLAYSLANRLSQVANPIACFMAFFIPTRSYKIIGILAAIGAILSAYIVVLASMSPSPPLVVSNGTTGAALAVAACIILTFIFSYVKVTIAELFRMEGRKALLWCGGMTQIGSLIGSFTIFILIIEDVFKDAPPC